MIERLKHLLKGGTSPHDIALGFAIGAFVSMMPGLGTPAALVVAFLFRLNKPAAVLGSLLSNPFTVGFLYAGGYWLGQQILQIEDAIRWKEVWTLQPGWWAELMNAIPAFLIGLVPLSLAIALLSYVLIRSAATAFQRRRRPPAFEDPSPS